MSTESTTMTTKQQIAREIVCLMEANARSIAMLTSRESIAFVEEDPLCIPHNLRHVIMPNNLKMVAAIEPHLDLFDADEQATITSFLDYMRRQERWLKRRWTPKLIEFRPEEFDDLMRKLAKQD